MKISLSNAPTLHLQVNPQFLAEELPSGIVFFEGIDLHLIASPEPEKTTWHHLGYRF